MRGCEHRIRLETEHAVFTRTVRPESSSNSIGLVVVVVDARWASCRMRSRHYVSQGECRQSAEAVTGWSGLGGFRLVGCGSLALFGV